MVVVLACSSLIRRASQPERRRGGGLGKEGGREGGGEGGRDGGREGGMERAEQQSGAPT